MYYDLLARIRNAQGARKHAMRVPYSNLDFEVAKILVRAKFLKDVRKKTYEKKHFLEVDMEGDVRHEHAIRGFTIMSKPGRRLYVSYRTLRPVKQGYGVGVLSTPQGLMTVTEARKQKVGGEYLFEVW